ncbi:MAG: hypothetical protein PHN31_00455 [Candidatus Gracilibacteria bacterium]|nr:hypothetical protein [Candidatus Gracilibacteria bacterium]
MNKISNSDNKKATIKEKINIFLENTGFGTNILLCIFAALTLNSGKNLIDNHILNFKNNVDKILLISKNIGDIKLENSLIYEHKRLVSIIRNLGYNGEINPYNLELFFKEKNSKIDISKDDLDFLNRLYGKIAGNKEKKLVNKENFSVLLINLLSSLYLSYSIGRNKTKTKLREIEVSTLYTDDTSAETIKTINSYRIALGLQSYENFKYFYNEIVTSYEYSTISRSGYKPFYCNLGGNEWDKFILKLDGGYEYDSFEMNIVDFIYFLEEEGFTFENIQINN